MKASELIHGGLYLIHDTSDIVVRYDITSNSFRSEWHEYPLALFHNDVCATDGDRYIFVKPIPLTEEIVKKNCWNQRPHSYVYERDGVPFALVIGKLELYVGECQSDDTIIFSLLYVHELQHALRLCGLNELADNFKITNDEETQPESSTL